MPRSLPRRLHLPARGLVSFARAGGELDAPPWTRAGPSSLDDAIALLSGPIAITDAAGARVDPRDLDVRDFHVLRAVATWAGLLREDPEEVACDNCGGRAFAVAPCASLEIGPWADGELDDPELDRPFAWDEPHALPPVATLSGRAETVRLAPRTVREAAPLFTALSRPTLRVTGAVVRAMGIIALGEETRPHAIARALGRASDAAWDELTALHEDAWYGPRLAADVPCPSCGAVAVVAAPAVRELTGGAPSPRAETDARDDDALADDAFEARVRALAAPLWEADDVADVALDVDTGPAAVDDGGVPLLGCYEPAGVDPDTGVHLPPRVRVFARTFRAMWRDEPYDVDAEIAETLEHELAHHRAHLLGHDEVDEEERRAIVRERERLVGRTESARRARADLAASLVDFARHTWPVWLLVALATWLAARAEGR